MRKVVAAVLLGVAAVGLTACSSEVTAEDVYKVGCPAVDSAVGGSGLISKATVAGLRKLSESGQLDPEPQRWLDATIALLESDNPDQAPSEAKQLIIDGCADNGYPLNNLK